MSHGNVTRVTPRTNAVVMIEQWRLGTSCWKSPPFRFCYGAAWLTLLNIILLSPAQFLVCLAKLMKLGRQFTNVHAQYFRKDYAHLTRQYQRPN